MTLPIGYALLNNRYRVTHLVGQGGFGAVYRAWDHSLLQTVALKENINSSIESQRQFEREATLLAGLRHPNLPRVIDHFILPNRGQYLVMDFIEGQSLAQLLRQRGRPLEEGEAREWIRQVCQTVQYLHSHTPPIIHRDIKPDNIIITAEGRAMLVDFGISKLYDAGHGTGTGAKAITPGYSPPEQYGIGKTDARSDVYALGATLYTLLTGQVPPEAVDVMSGTEALLPPRQLNPAISQAADQAIAAAMTPSVSQRVESVARFEQILNSHAAPSQPSPGWSSPPPSTPPPARPRQGHGRRGRWFGGVVAGLALVILGAAAWVALAVREKPPPTPTAELTSISGVAAIATVTSTLTASPTLPPTASSPTTPPTPAPPINSPTPRPTVIPLPTPTPRRITRPTLPTLTPRPIARPPLPTLTPRPSLTPSPPPPPPTSQPINPPTTYTNYVEIYDDALAIKVQVPVEWADIQRRNWFDDNGAVLGSRLVASTNIAAYTAGYVTSGMQMHAAISRDNQTPRQHIDKYIPVFSQHCNYDGDFSYSDDKYTGVYDRYSNCDGAGSQLIVLGAEPAAKDHYVIVMVQVVTPADLDALNRILKTFNVVGPLPGQ